MKKNKYDLDDLDIDAIKSYAVPSSSPLYEEESTKTAEILGKALEEYAKGWMAMDCDDVDIDRWEISESETGELIAMVKPENLVKWISENVNLKRKR